VITVQKALLSVVLIVSVTFAVSLPASAQDPIPTPWPEHFPLPPLEVITPENADRVVYLGTLDGFTDWVSDAAFSPDGTLVAAVSRYEGTLLWKTQTGELAGGLDHKCYSPVSIAFHPDGATFATSCMEDLLMWNTADVLDGGEIEPIGVFESVENYIGVTFSPDGVFVAASSSNGFYPNRLVLGDVATSTIMVGLEGDEICCPAFSSDGTTLAYAQNDGIHYLNIATREETIVSLSEIPEGLVFSSDLALAAGIGGGEASSGAKSDVYLFDLETGALVSVLRNNDNHLPSRLAFSPDGRLLVSTSAYYYTLLWDIESLERLVVLPMGAVTDLEFSPDGRLIVMSRAGSGISSFVQLWGVPIEQGN
jgi:WD40 repeat protein